LVSAIGDMCHTPGQSLWLLSCDTLESNVDDVSRSDLLYHWTGQLYVSHAVYDS